MWPRKYGDAGQAFPIYITVVAGLLFLAFAYVAVGQAAVTRNGAQTAADAAALAAAQDTRDKLAEQWKLVVDDPAKWQDILDGHAAVLDGCERAGQLAARNEAHLLGCDPQLADLSYTVQAETDGTVGESIVPGTESRHAKASAKAVIQPLCQFPPLGTDPGGDAPPQLTCEHGRRWPVNPDDPTDLPEPKDLFDVHLAD
ncbi:pilus assembly protein TadG-related protein [Streptomyces sp. NPDC001102]